MAHQLPCPRLVRLRPLRLLVQASVVLPRLLLVPASVLLLEASAQVVLRRPSVAVRLRVASPVVLLALAPLGLLDVPLSLATVFGAVLQALLTAALEPACTADP